MTTYNTLMRQLTDPGRPFLTFVASTVRIELSGTTFRNAADKIANGLLAEGLVESGDVIGLHLPWHWQRFTWCAGAWLIGATIVPWGEPADVSCVVADPMTAGDLASRAHTPVIVVTMHPFGLGSPEEVPPGAIDGTVLTRTQPDRFLGDPTAADAPLLQIAGARITAGDASAFVEAYPAGERLALRPGEDALHWIVPTWYPMVREGSIVCADENSDISAERAEVMRG